MKHDMNETIARLRGRKVMIIGDLMLDHYLIGMVERISPEAPVPVVRVDKEKFLLGGAGNVAVNIAALGGESLLVGVVGDDREGDELRGLCNKAQLSTNLLCDPSRPTTKKSRIMAQNQQICRVDSEDCGPLGSVLMDELFKYLQAHLHEYPVVILSDYGKGFISAEFMDRFNDLLESMEARPKVLVDPKVVNYDLYKGVDILTPNTKEAGEGAGIVVSDKHSVIRAGHALFKRLECRNLLITMGGDGMALFEGTHNIRHIPTFAKTVFDVTGAGDTVIATLGLALAAGVDLLTACTLANHAAGIVVGQVGAACATADELDAVVADHQGHPVTQW
ncbi:D-glycero-beta-D-manno-heptose-7-phosphate kinase [Pseudodesulfovibrio senegalensis]|uniref:D-glycero-beta-D-manno-heptose-7-phosphate kinase n=2 Tax=Pseudodesulfovibrio senegalensis TaxID=1721087 RepID=A0A6N6N1W6_9BACT|nr:D-glycero-beta-D-manno-heptose-7-phosphate kinase [Pseudodesulfovibrio senegalensis]